MTAETQVLVLILLGVIAVVLCLIADEIPRAIDRLTAAIKEKHD